MLLHYQVSKSLLLLLCDCSNQVDLSYFALIVLFTTELLLLTRLYTMKQTVNTLKNI